MGKINDVIIENGRFKGEWLTDASIHHLKWIRDYQLNFPFKELLNLTIYINEDGGDIRKYIKRNGREM